MFQRVVNFPMDRKITLLYLNMILTKYLYEDNKLKSFIIFTSYNRQSSMK